MPHSGTLTVIFSLLSTARASIITRGPPIQSTAECLLDSNPGWAFSKEGLSPCYLLAAVSAPCYQGVYITKPVTSGNHYDPPSKANKTVNQCTCSWAAYNLMMACTACQGQLSSISTWPSYRTECGELVSSTTYWPSDIDITSNHTIPFYAGTNPNSWTNQRFNVADAKLIAEKNDPDLTGAVSSNGSSNGSTDKKTIPLGPIIGGVLGGIALLVLSLILFRMYRRRRAPYHGFQEIQPGTPGYVQSISQIGRDSVYTAVLQTPPADLPRSRVVSPAPTMGMGSPHIQPFLLTAPDESAIAYRRKSDGTINSVAASSLQQPAPAVAGPSGSGSTERVEPRSPEPVGRWQGLPEVEEEEEGEEEHQPRTTRRRSPSPPAYDTLVLSPSETREVAAILRTRTGNSHRSHMATPEMGSQDSLTSWTSFFSGPVSESTCTMSRTPTMATVRPLPVPGGGDEVQTPRADTSHVAHYHSTRTAESSDVDLA